MSINQVQISQHNHSYEYQQQSYQSNPQQYSPIIEGYFPKEISLKEMAIRKINTTLTILLFIALFFTAVSYYFATANEITLNNLSRQTIILNDENADLQNKLDKLKSFNNVDITMQKNNMLQKAQQVIEIPAVSLSAASDKKIDAKKPFAWSIGY